MATISRKIRVITGMQDVTLTIDDKVLGSEFLLQVVSELGVDDKDWLGLQYSDLSGRWWWLQDNKKVLAQRVRPVADPLIMFLKVKLYPPRPSQLTDTTVQRLVYLQLKAAVEVGELICPAPRNAILSALAGQDSVLKYLETAEELEEYGLWHFIVMRPHDPTPVRLSIGTTGFFITENNRKISFPFSELQGIQANGRKLVLQHIAKSLPDTIFQGSDDAHIKDLHYLAVLHKEYYLVNNAC